MLLALHSNGGWGAEGRARVLDGESFAPTSAVSLSAGDGVSADVDSAATSVVSPSGHGPQSPTHHSRGMGRRSGAAPPEDSATQIGTDRADVAVAYETAAATSGIRPDVRAYSVPNPVTDGLISRQFPQRAPPLTADL